MREHERLVAGLVARTEAEARDRCAQGEDAGCEPQAVKLPYFKNQDHYDRFPHPNRSLHTWGNAVSRRAADILRVKGYRVLFYYPSAGELDG